MQSHQPNCGQGKTNRTDFLEDCVLAALVKELVKVKTTVKI